MKETIGKLCIAGLAYFSDVKPMIIAVLVFVTIDCITGLYASWKLKIPIESYRMRRTVEKFVFYLLAIVVANILEKEFIDFANIDRIVAAYIAITEVKSIFENITKITGIEIFNRIIEVIRKQYKIYTDNK